MRDAEIRAGGEAMMQLMKQGWGRKTPAFRQLWTSLFIPGAGPEEADWYNEMQRVASDAETAVALLLAIGWRSRLLGVMITIGLRNGRSIWRRSTWK